MLPRRTHQLGAAMRTLEVQLDVVLPGDRDPAVQLHCLTGDPVQRTCRLEVASEWLLDSCGPRS